jgi:Uma2 family endonuclease
MKSGNSLDWQPIGGRHAIFREVSDLHAITPDQVRPLKRAEYDKLVELGVFEDERLELLYGLIVRMSPIGAPHCWSVQVLNELLLPPLLGRASVRVGLPYAASDESEPQPDVAIAAREDYRRDHPPALLCAIEVADSSLSKDRGLKARLYAEAGVPEYWIVNLRDRVIEVRTRPTGGVYAEVAIYRSGDLVRLNAFPDVTVAVDSVIG